MDIELSEIQTVLKRITKAKGLTYSELAKLLKLSESGVKKLLTSRDLSFRKIKLICDALEVSLSDVLDEVRAVEIREERFTDEQERFFLKNLDYFYFFWKLVVEREPIKKIQKDNSLLEKQVSMYLRKLDQLGIIELHPFNKIKIPRRESKRWVGTGPLTQKIQKDWGAKLWSESSENFFKGSKDSSTFIRHLKLSQSSFQDLKLALNELEQEFVNRSTREQSLSREELQTVRLMSAASKGSFVDSI